MILAGGGHGIANSQPENEREATCRLPGLFYPMLSGHLEAETAHEFNHAAT